MGAPIPPSEARRLAEEVADPAQHPINQAIALAQASAARGAIGNHLGDMLRREAERTGGGRKAELLRLLGLLSALDCEHMVLPVRGQLVADPDAEIRSKAVLMAGRSSKNLPWIARRLLDPSPRVQANAVEALWGIDAPEARELLSSSLASPDCRTAGNALVGLHKIGDAGCLGRLFQMAEHPEEAFRVAARWAMGETGDPRFVPYLMKASKADTGKCHGMVIRSLTRLRRRAAALETAGRLELKVWDARILPGGGRRIGFSCWRASQEDHIPLGLLEVAITEGSRLITEYAMKAWPYPDTLLVGCARPRIASHADPYRLAIESGLMQCAKVKRKRDLWAGDRYLTAGSDPPDAGGLYTGTEDPAIENHVRANRGFLRDAEIIAKVIPGPGTKTMASLSMLASIRKLMDLLSRASGSRHLIVCLDPEYSLVPADLEGIAQDARAIDLAIHGVAPDSLKDCAAFEALCEACGGTFQRLPAENGGDEMLRSYESLLNRYQITYVGQEPAGERVSAEIKLGCTRGVGAVTANLC